MTEPGCYVTASCVWGLTNKSSYCLKGGIPKTMGINTRMVYIKFTWSNFGWLCGVTTILRKPQKKSCKLQRNHSSISTMAIWAVTVLRWTTNWQGNVAVRARELMIQLGFPYDYIPLYPIIYIYPIISHYVYIYIYPIVSHYIPLYPIIYISHYIPLLTMINMATLHHVTEGF